MDIQCLGVTEIVGAPHPVDELTSGKHASSVTHEHLEELEFLQRHADLAAVHGNRVAVDVERDAAALEETVVQIRLGSSQPSEHSAHPSQELAGRIGLGDVVVGAEFEPHDDVDLGVLRREHNDRNGRRRTQLPTHLGSGHPGKHEIEQHNIRPQLAERGQGRGAVFSDLDLVALTAQQIGERVGEVWLVLHQ